MQYFIYNYHYQYADFTEKIITYIGYLLEKDNISYLHQFDILQNNNLKKDSARILPLDEMNINEVSEFLIPTHSFTDRLAGSATE